MQIKLFLILILSLKAFSYSFEQSQSSENYNYNSQELTKWFKVKNPKYFAIAIHGLNARPSSMDAVILQLNKLNISVLRVSLRGHRGDIKELEAVNTSTWQKDLDFHIQMLYSENTKSLPVIGLGYSIGGLLLANKLVSDSQFKLEKLVLLSPAIDLAWYVELAKNGIGFVSKKRRIVSFNSKDYQANLHMTANAYNSFVEIYQHFKNKKMDKLINIPAILVIDPDDELISAQKIEENFVNKSNGQWSLYKMPNEGAEYHNKAHHLFLDSVTMGQQSWKKFTLKLNDFLK